MNRTRAKPIRATISERELKAILWAVKYFTSQGYASCNKDRKLFTALKKAELNLTQTFSNVLDKN